MQELQAFQKLLDTPKRVVITAHANPDADALGAALGLATYLKKKQHQVDVITPTDYPRFLHWMGGHKDVIVFNDGQEKKSAQLIDQADIIFCLDFSSFNRIEGMGEMVRMSTAVKVVVDHHAGKEDFADYELWDTKAAATCELLYQLIVDLGDRELIDKDLAENLYAGIMTDTGSFKHPNTTKHVHEVVADLIELGADVAKVSKLVYDTNSVDRLRFIGYALSEKLVVLPHYKTAYFAITADDLEKFNSRTGDTEGLVNYALSIEGITMAAIIIERSDAVKLSFRSIGNFPVNELAAKHFEGGGHKNAAGGISHVSLEETVEKFIQLLPSYKAQLHKNQKEQELHLT